MQNVVNGVKDLKLDSRQALTLETPESSRAAKAFQVTPPEQGSIPNMSLPGLDLSAPVESVVNPTIYELKEQTEWRFEVAFQSKVEVRVLSPASSTLFKSLSARIDERIAASFRYCRAFRHRASNQTSLHFHRH